MNMTKMKLIKKLEYAHVNFYIPHGLEFEFEGKVHKVVSLCPNNGIAFADPDNKDDWGWDRVHIDNFKPLLRPLSDLTKEITHFGETFCMAKKIYIKQNFDIPILEETGWEFTEGDGQLKVYHPLCQTHNNVLWIHKLYMGDNPTWMFLELIKYHFDVFDLIVQGFAEAKK